MISIVTSERKSMLVLRVSCAVSSQCSCGRRRVNKLRTSDGKRADHFSRTLNPASNWAKQRQMWRY